jgi:hypothetical protein
MPHRPPRPPRFFGALVARERRRLSTPPAQKLLQLLDPFPQLLVLALKFADDRILVGPGVDLAIEILSRRLSRIHDACGAIHVR